MRNLLRCGGTGAGDDKLVTAFMRFMMILLIAMPNDEGHSDVDRACGDVRAADNADHVGDNCECWG